MEKNFKEEEEGNKRKKVGKFWKIWDFIINNFPEYSLGFCEIPGNFRESRADNLLDWVEICKFRRKSIEILKNGAKVGKFS